MTDPHAPKYEWTDGGKQLLSELLIRIDLYGGREKLARDIENEIAKPCSRPPLPKDIVNGFTPFSNAERMFITRNYHRLTASDIAKVLKRSKRAVESKIIRMQKRGLVPKKQIN